MTEESAIDIEPQALETLANAADMEVKYARRAVEHLVRFGVPMESITPDVLKTVSWLDDELGGWRRVADRYESQLNTQIERSMMRHLRTAIQSSPFVTKTALVTHDDCLAVEVTFKGGARIWTTVEVAQHGRLEDLMESDSK